MTPNMIMVMVIKLFLNKFKTVHYFVWETFLYFTKF